MSSRDDPPAAIPDWTFLSNHAHVLICLASGEDPVLREVAQQVGITERGVQRIVAELEEEGLVTRERVGRRNHYRLHLDRPLRHPLEAHCSVRALVELMAREPLHGRLRKHR